MKYNPLGNSGLLVSELCLGTIVFGEDGSRGTDQETGDKRDRVVLFCLSHYHLDDTGRDVVPATRIVELPGTHRMCP